LQTGKITKVEYLQHEERSQALVLLMKVWGVGLSKANKLYRMGMRTIEDLRNNLHLLSNNQKLGLKYFEDSQIRIPYDEVTEIFQIIKTSLYEILPEEIVEAVVCGSYRRKKPTCGDMDVLITRKDDGKIDGILDSLLDNLKKIGIIKETLSTSRSFSSKSQFNGICKLRDDLPNRRIDIKVYYLIII